MDTPPPPQDPADGPRTAEATLTAGDVDDLFRDLSACAQIQHISAKQSAGQQSAAALGDLDLPRARALLHEQAVHGLQLRYLHEGALWIDTLTQTPDGYRLLRVRHDETPR